MSSFKWKNSCNISIAKENGAKGLGLKEILQREVVWCSVSLHLSAFMFHTEILDLSYWVEQAGLNASFILSNSRDLQESFLFWNYSKQPQVCSYTKLLPVAPRSSQTSGHTLFPNTAWSYWDWLGIGRAGTAGCATLCWGNHKSSNRIALWPLLVSFGLSDRRTGSGPPTILQQKSTT